MSVEKTTPLLRMYEKLISKKCAQKAIKRIFFFLNSTIFSELYRKVSYQLFFLKSYDSILLLKESFSSITCRITVILIKLKNKS